MTLLVRSIALSAMVALLSAAAGGCQFAETVSTAKLIQHQAMVDPSGLRVPAEIPTPPPEESVTV